MESHTGPSQLTSGSLQWGQGEDVSLCPTTRRQVCLQELYLKIEINETLSWY